MLLPINIMLLWRSFLAAVVVVLILKLCPEYPEGLIPVTDKAFLNCATKLLLVSGVPNWKLKNRALLCPVLYTSHASMAATRNKSLLVLKTKMSVQDDAKLRFSRRRLTVTEPVMTLQKGVRGWGCSDVGN